MFFFLGFINLVSKNKKSLFSSGYEKKNLKRISKFHKGDSQYIKR
jgi:hypothetical protein